MKPMTMFLTQLLPLIVFIVVDSFVTDVRISIATAILFAVGQLLVTYVRNRRFDWFVLLDVALITGLGAVSIVLRDELFFRIKPAVIEGVTIIFMFALVLAPRRFLTGYFGRMMPAATLRPEVIGKTKSMLGWMCLLVALHIGAVLYAAFYSSRAVWAFVSGPGFYLMLVPVLVVSFGRVLRARRAARRSARAQSVAPGASTPEAPPPAGRSRRRSRPSPTS